MRGGGCRQIGWGRTCRGLGAIVRLGRRGQIRWELMCRQSWRRAGPGAQTAGQNMTGTLRAGPACDARRHMRSHRICPRLPPTLPPFLPIPDCRLAPGRSAPSPHVAQDLARRVVPRNAGHAAARMRAGAAEVQAAHRRPVVAVTEHRSRREQLVERQRAVEDVAADEPELALEIERRERATAEDAGLEIRRDADRPWRSSGRRPRRARRPRSGPPRPPAASGCTCWQKRLATCIPGGASESSTTDGISISTIGAADQPRVRASKYARSM